ncbi:hypothetical protein F3Y22_tig00001713pilonHSYRG00148 [Hibiscus syriacus]|uniref:Uncharacterized protein n=1 Tax=Hibiscus syriacus TaxID=106335 RepID=A0A6A3D044_HIBSY|nr:hypothetical protein F3Y22_tig00001713pilonHSYRG00148 [Hibiscus syriacus]
MRSPTTRDPIETESTGEPALLGAGVGAASLAPPGPVVGAPAVGDGCTPTNLAANFKNKFSRHLRDGRNGDTANSGQGGSPSEIQSNAERSTALKRRAQAIGVRLNQSSSQYSTYFLVLTPDSRSTQSIVLNCGCNAALRLHPKLIGLNQERDKKKISSTMETSKCVLAHTNLQLLISPERLPSHQAGSSVAKTQAIVIDPQDNPTDYNMSDSDEMKKAKNEILENLKNWCRETFKRMREQSFHDEIDASELFWVPNLVLPPKFKMYD